MASLIQGYEYDIFISYRQKDNKGDRWVSEFVEALKTELESTFKEEISVYFDINPHDGLLETHDVDASLKDKLKCLLFIPIISRTYCDPKSFAWEHEFKAFVEQASQDQFGLKVRLPNGNVASRVLPVRIHDLDSDDIKLYETILGGYLRGIEFIYKEPGVNRPLTPVDDEKKNLNNTRYRNQINKTSLAIKEIIHGMKTEDITVVKEKILLKESLEEVRKEVGAEIKEKSIKLSKIRLLSGVFITAVLIVVAILAYPKIFKKDTLDRLISSGERISIAVMPFQNMTGDTTWNTRQGWIQDILINSLSNQEELRIKPAEDINSMVKNQGIINYASISPSVASIIAKKLDANILIYGNIKQVGTIIRLNAQLINSKSENVFKSFQLEGISKEEKIFNLIDSLSTEIKNFLVLFNLLKESTPDNQKYLGTTTIPQAYNYSMEGDIAFTRGDYSMALNLYLQSIAFDSNYLYPYIYISYAYVGQGNFDEAKKWCLKAYEKRNFMSRAQKVETNTLYGFLFETPYEMIRYIKQALEYDDQLPRCHADLGWAYNIYYQYDKAIYEYKKAIKIYDKLEVKPFVSYDYTGLGYAYHTTKQYQKEKRLYMKAEQDFPNDPTIIYRQTLLALSKGKTKDANNYFEKYIFICRENSVSEATIAANLASIYEEAEILDKAEGYFRQAYSLEPNSPGRMNTLAYFLIDKDRNIDEGMGLVEKALQTSSDNYNYLHTKGWGLYKQGKYQEAFDILQKSWDLRMKNAIYDHSAFLHLEEAKKAVANQKNY